MKKSLVIFAIIIFLFSSIDYISSEITGEIITGKPTSETLALNISVSLPTVVVSIINPENDTYLFNESILLNYTQTNADYIWYNLDLGVNTTISDIIYFNVSEGEHTLYLYGNNTNGERPTNVSFIANTTFLIIYYSEYNGSTKGNSTNFISYGYTNLQNLSDIILENSVYGKIQFNEIINITNDNMPNDRIVDLDANTNISLNRIDLNYTTLPNFNVSSTLYIYNLPFTNPRILKDGSVCPTSICTLESFENSTLKFNITEFGTYSSEETPSTEVVTPPGGGGSGYSKPKAKDFSINIDSIQVSLKQGESTYRELTIKNKEKSILSFTLSSFGLEEIMTINEEIFSLSPGEEKTIRLDFTASKDTSPDLYIGKLTIKSGTTQKEIPIAVEIASPNSLFDIRVNIPNKYKQVLAGKEIEVGIQLFSFFLSKEVEVNLEYTIKNKETGEIIILEQDKVNVEGELAYTRKFIIPEGSEMGEYLFYAKIDYEEKIASATDTFKISNDFAVFFNRSQLTLIILISIILLFLIILLIKRKKKKEEKKYKFSKNFKMKRIIISSD